MDDLKPDCVACMAVSVLRHAPSSVSAEEIAGRCGIVAGLHATLMGSPIHLMCDAHRYVAVQYANAWNESDDAKQFRREKLQ